MLVRDIGEFQLIDTLAQAIADRNARAVESLSARGFRLHLSIGDDAAAWKAPPGVRVLTTDTMVEGVHFNLGQIGWRDLGWKASAVNLSDIAAMGCEPLYSVITLGLRSDLPVDGLVEMYRGMLDACDSAGGAIVGGDVVRSPVFFITVALEGTAAAFHGDDPQRPKVLTRDSASPGDKVAVTGSLGCSAGGLRVLTEATEEIETGAYDADTADHLKDAHRRPMPRIPQGIELLQRGVIAAMDISDGLVDDLEKLCKASQVGAVIRSDLVPADEFLKRAYPADWLTLALSGGEDYELLFTAPETVMDTVTSTLSIPVTVIGEVVEAPPQVTVLDSDGRAMSVERGGWDHFR